MRKSQEIVNMEKIPKASNSFTLCDGFFHDRYATESEILYPFYYSPSYQTNHSVWREALDYYLLFSEKQILRILHEFIDYYNSKRPHQGINQQVPIGYEPMINGKVLKFPVLGGLCNHYVRRAA